MNQNKNDMWEQVRKDLELPEFKEILRLKEMLEEVKIPFDFIEWIGGYLIAYPSREERVCSVIEHCSSGGNYQDLLEIMGLLTEEELKHNNVVGWLTAEDVFNRIKKHYEVER